MGEIGGEQRELRRNLRPIVKRGLEGRRDMGRVGAPGEVVADDDEAAVAA